MNRICTVDTWFRVILPAARPVLRFGWVSKTKLQKHTNMNEFEHSYLFLLRQKSSIWDRINVKKQLHFGLCKRMASKAIAMPRFKHTVNITDQYTQANTHSKQYIAHIDWRNKQL